MYLDKYKRVQFLNKYEPNASFTRHERSIEYCPSELKKPVLSPLIRRVK
jgi:hypothetical protein